MSLEAEDATGRRVEFFFDSANGSAPGLVLPDGTVLPPDEARAVCMWYLRGGAFGYGPPADRRPLDEVIFFANHNIAAFRHAEQVPSEQRLSTWAVVLHGMIMRGVVCSRTRVALGTMEDTTVGDLVASGRLELDAALRGALADLDARDMTAGAKEGQGR